MEDRTQVERVKYSENIVINPIPDQMSTIRDSFLVVSSQKAIIARPTDKLAISPSQTRWDGDNTLFASDISTKLNRNFRTSETDIFMHHPR